MLDIYILFQITKGKDASSSVKCVPEFMALEACKFQTCSLPVKYGAQYKVSFVHHKCPHIIDIVDRHK